MSRIETLIRESIALKEEFLASGGEALLRRMADAMVASLKQGHRLYLCGNGGSASDAQHIAGEFIGRFMMERAPLPCMALNCNTSVLTCIGNDYSFDEIFERQVNGLVEKGDVLMGFSTSGNSENVLRAVRAAKARGAVTIGFAGKDGGKLAQEADLCLVARCEVTARVQELHITCAHVLCDLVESEYFA